MYSRTPLESSPYVFIASEQIYMVMIMKGSSIKQNMDDSLTYPPLDKLAAISQMIFSDAFLWMESLYLRSQE